MPSLLTYFNTLAWYLSFPHGFFNICIFRDNKPLEVGLLTMTLVYGTKPPLLFVGQGTPPLTIPQIS